MSRDYNDENLCDFFIFRFVLTEVSR